MSWFVQAQIYGGVKQINVVPPPLLITGSLTSKHI